MQDVISTCQYKKLSFPINNLSPSAPSQPLLMANIAASIPAKDFLNQPEIEIEDIESLLILGTEILLLGFKNEYELLITEKRSDSSEAPITIP